MYGKGGKGEEPVGRGNRFQVGWERSLSRSQDPKQPMLHGAELGSEPGPSDTWASKAVNSACTKGRRGRKIKNGSPWCLSIDEGVSFPQRTKGKCG